MFSNHCRSRLCTCCTTDYGEIRLRTSKRWQLRPHDPAGIDRLSRELSISPVLAQLLLNRGLIEGDKARQFLSARRDGLHDPGLLPGVEEAARRVHAALKSGRRICIYGDYDVDGTTGTTLLWRCLQVAGAGPQQVQYYVPDRVAEGYGLNSQALQTIAERGNQLVITVDCGITAVAEAEEARRLGLELIITDHHEPKPQLPAADVLVHPRLPGSAYPFGDLCGAGVAFKLAWAISREVSQAKRVTDAFRQFLLESMAMVGLATVADVVPLIDENRIFVRHGLRSLREAPSIGLKALLESAGVTERELSTEDIGFNLGPRLNAAGRMMKGQLAVELLTTTRPERAAELCEHLKNWNKERQKIERRIFDEAKRQVEAEYDLEKCPALVLSHPEWHPGVIGIVASRLVERYARPVLMVSFQDKVGRGSGRSIPGLHLNEALAACADLLDGHGGHAMAAGFKVDRSRLDSLRERFNAHVTRCTDGQPYCPTIVIDAEVPLSVMTVGLVKGIAGLQPHGAGNPRPCFLASELEITGEPRLVGDDQRHMSFLVRQAGTTLKAIAFSMADRLQELLSAERKCSLVFVPKLNEWQGRVSVDLEVQDFQPGVRPQLA